MPGNLDDDKGAIARDIFNVQAFQKPTRQDEDDGQVVGPA